MYLGVPFHQQGLVGPTLRDRNPIVDVIFYITRVGEFLPTRIPLAPFFPRTLLCGLCRRARRGEGDGGGNCHLGKEERGGEKREEEGKELEV